MGVWGPNYPEVLVTAKKQTSSIDVINSGTFANLLRPRGVSNTLRVQGPK